MGLIVLILCAQFAYAQKLVLPEGYSVDKTAVIGSDQRLEPQAFPKGDKIKKYSAVGLMYCRNPDKTAKNKFLTSGTATLVENSQTIISAAHVFAGPNGELRSKLENCFFNILNEQGVIVATAQIESVEMIKNPNEANISESTTVHNDWAVAKLKTPLEQIVPFQVAKPNENLTVNQSIQICAFNGDLADKKIKRCLSGKYRDNGADEHYYKNEKLLFHDIDTNGAASGSPVFIDDPSGTPKIYAIHTGGKCDAGWREYHVDYCSNMAVLFGSEFYAALAKVLRSTGGPVKFEKTNQNVPVKKNVDRGVST